MILDDNNNHAIISSLFDTTYEKTAKVNNIEFYINAKILS